MKVFILYNNVDNVDNNDNDDDDDNNDISGKYHDIYRLSLSIVTN